MLCSTDTSHVKVSDDVRHMSVVYLRGEEEGECEVKNEIERRE